MSQHQQIDALQDELINRDLQIAAMREEINNLQIEVQNLRGALSLRQAKIEALREREAGLVVDNVELQGRVVELERGMR